MTAKKQMIKFFKKTIPVWIALAPYTAFGAIGDWFHLRSSVSTRYVTGYGGGGGGLWNLFWIAMDILNNLIILFFALAVVFFLYGILKYIYSADNEDSRKASRDIMVYGIIGLFVMVSFWGFVNILINTFELDTYPYVEVPYLPPSGGGGTGTGGLPFEDNTAEGLPLDGIGGSVP